MTYKGHITNGAIVLDEEAPMPEGAEVRVEIVEKPAKLDNFYGMWAKSGRDITEEDIDEARREMWGNFPRDDI